MNDVLRESEGAVFKDSAYVDVGQRRWELKFSASREHFLRPADYVQPWAASAAVLVASLLLSGLIHSLTGSRQRAQTLAAQMTADLRESHARLAEEQRRTQELIEALPNPIYFKATDGRYLGVNKAWEAFFGIPRRAFLGKTEAIIAMAHGLKLKVIAEGTETRGAIEIPARPRMRRDAGILFQQAVAGARVFPAGAEQHHGRRLRVRRQD